MPSLIERALQSRRVIFQGAIIATLVALGVNLISSWLAEYFKEHQPLILFVGALFILIGFLYFIQHLLAERHQSLDIDSVILLDPKKKCVVPANEYGFSETLEQTLSAAFVENEALKQAWEREMFPERKEGEGPSPDVAETKPNDDGVGYFSIVKMEVSEDEATAAENHKILLEAIEFCFLEYLSMHLSEYFDHRAHDEKQVCVLERQDIPHMVLTNRILALLTTPIEDRQIFTKSGINKNPPKDGEIHAIYASNGAVYEKFHLALPVNTSISRPATGQLIFEHPRFYMTMQVTYRGFGQNLPTYFSDLYVSDSIERLDARQVRISVSATLRPLAFLHLSGWEYYQWIDSLFEYLHERASFKDFLKCIDWISVATRIRAGIIRERRIEKRKSVKMTKPVADALSETVH